MCFLKNQALSKRKDYLRVLIDCALIIKLFSLAYYKGKRLKK